MDYVLYAGLALAVLISVVLIYAATKPNTFRIERSIAIQAPSGPIFDILSDNCPAISRRASTAYEKGLAYLVGKWWIVCQKAGFSRTD